NGYINIDNKKMSKSLGNFFTVRDIAAEFDLSTVRFFILSAHYRNPINFSRDLIKAAENSLERIYNAKNNLDYLISLNKNPKTDDDKEFNEELNKYKKQFCDAMDDDFNTADAIAAIFELVKFININADENSSQHKLHAAKNLLNELTGVLGIAQINSSQILDKDIEELIRKRQQARKDKDFALADKIRDELKAQNIILEDTKEGVKWKRI
ncbi:MAG: class I tRNA ligase family protein, partial [Eubacteriaceae bacterium]|nr:class I tRNA ligase family protein [Eubacteriaceae bacterium]